MSKTVTIEFLQPDGAIDRIETPVGNTVMQAAILNNVAGIDAECGGSCMCATCHVYIDTANQDACGEPSEIEAEMLDCAEAELRPESRLGCQITVTEQMDGTRFRVPQA